MATRYVKRKRGGAVLFHGICPGVKARFKAACAREGINMRQAAALLMKLYAGDKEVRRAVKKGVA